MMWTFVTFSNKSRQMIGLSDGCRQEVGREAYGVQPQILAGKGNRLDGRVFQSSRPFDVDEDSLRHRGEKSCLMVA